MRRRSKKSFSKQRGERKFNGGPKFIFKNQGRTNETDVQLFIFKNQEEGHSTKVRNSFSKLRGGRMRRRSKIHFRTLGGWKINRGLKFIFKIQGRTNEIEVSFCPIWVFLNSESPSTNLPFVKPSCDSTRLMIQSFLFRYRTAIIYTICFFAKLDFSELVNAKKPQGEINH